MSSPVFERATAKKDLLDDLLNRLTGEEQELFGHILDDMCEAGIDYAYYDYDDED